MGDEIYAKGYVAKKEKELTPELQIEAIGRLLEQLEIMNRNLKWIAVSLLVCLLLSILGVVMLLVVMSGIQ
tara:strand:- start:1930 stop:2142 length:213 start_codon:yes stop_codon:yes gene_type:complete